MACAGVMACTEVMASIANAAADASHFATKAGAALQEIQPAAPEVVELDPLSLIVNSSGVVMCVVWLLIIAAIGVWFVAALKMMQLVRWRGAERRFELDASQCTSARELFDVARHHNDAPGARVVMALQVRRAVPAVLESTAKRSLVEEQERASTLMPVLSTIGSASPFVGLFGTVWGIMDAFLRIGREKSASLPVVAPAIGEALIATAIGLFAAIPAVIAYNFISKRVDDLLSTLEATADGWVALVLESTHARTGPQPNEAMTPLSQPLPLTSAPSQTGGGSTPPPLPQV